MTDEDETTGKPHRFQTLRTNPPRDVLPWAAVVVGVVLILRGVVDLSRHDDPSGVLSGAGLVVIGLVVFFIKRWQARRGL